MSRFFQLRGGWVQEVALAAAAVVTDAEIQADVKIIGRAYALQAAQFDSFYPRIECFYKARVEGIKLRCLQSVRSANNLDIRLNFSVRDDRGGCRGHLLDPATPQLEETRHQPLSIHCESKGHRRCRATV